MRVCPFVSKFLLRFIAAVLIPCLVASSTPVWAAYTLVYRVAETTHLSTSSSVFQTEALITAADFTNFFLLNRIFNARTVTSVGVGLLGLALATQARWITQGPTRVAQASTRKSGKVPKPVHSPFYNRIVKMISSPHYNDRWNAIEEAIDAKDPQFVKVFLNHAKNERHIGVQGAYALYFSTIGDPRATTQLVEWLNQHEGSPVVTGNTLVDAMSMVSPEYALGRLHDPKIIPSAIQALEHGGGVVAGTKEVVKGFGPESISALDAFWIINELPDSDPRKYPVLIRALRNNPEALIREVIAYELAQQAKDLPAVVQPVLQALKTAVQKDLSFDVRRSAAGGLKTLGEPHWDYFANVYEAIFFKNLNEVKRLASDSKYGKEVMNILQRATQDDDIVGDVAAFAKSALKAIADGKAAGIHMAIPPGSVRLSPDNALPEDRGDYGASVDVNGLNMNGMTVRIHFAKGTPNRTKVVARLLPNILDADYAIGLVQRDGKPLILEVHNNMVEFTAEETGLPAETLAHIAQISGHSKKFAWTLQLGDKNPAAYIDYFEYFPTPKKATTKVKKSSEIRLPHFGFDNFVPFVPARYRLFSADPTAGNKSLAEAS
jgi:hypothetical protein